MIEHMRVDNIDRFMADIEQYPRLTQEQEIECYNKMHSGNYLEAEEAREKLITSNLKLVVALAHTFKRWAPLSDAVQDGCLGLITAVDKYDPNINPRFSIGASFWIKNSIRKSILNNSRTVRIPCSAAQMAATVAKRKHAFVAEFGREPTDAELSEILQLSAKRINGAHVADISIASLDDKVTEDDDTTFEDMLHEVIDDEDDTPADMPDAIRDVRALIKKLPDKDRFLLERTYGIGCDVVPIEVLMQETGMSMTCIRGRLHTLKRHLRSVLEDKRYSF